jgi:dolichyl-phosphate beta-glucosyltransferase
VRNGMLHAQGEMRLFSDADLSSPIEEAGKLFSALAGGGYRHRLALVAQRSANPAPAALSLALRTDFQPVAGDHPRIEFQRHAVRLQSVHLQGNDDFSDAENRTLGLRSGTALPVARKFKLKVVEVPVAWAHREGTLRDGTKMVLEMLKIRWNALSGKYRSPAKARPPSVT